jgi:hypothetical protein
MELVARKRACTGKVEGVFSGKEKGMFKDGKQYVREEGLSKAKRPLV